MNKYIPNSFKDIYETPFGQSLWSFLNSHEIIIRMETASKLSKPALEAIDALLLNEFKEKITEDRVKQMCGNMVRQVMEHHGYHWERNGVSIKNKILFSRASRYKKN